VTDALVFLAVTVAVAAVVCGHQGQPWPLAGLWRAVAAPLAASGALRALRPLREAPDAPEGLLAPSPTRVLPTGAPATGPSRATVPRQNAPEGPDGTPGPPDAPRPAQSRTGPPAPSWARKDAA
jgi:hypothetical protein